MSEIEKKAEKWSNDPFSKETREKVKELYNNKKLLEDCFYKDLEFGTGGMRGIMGVGTNRINKYTLGKNTQGICNYLNKTEKGEIKVAIAFDCRNNSESFAKIVADVFSANKIKVYIFNQLRPTPELSFAVKNLNCNCGIVLTASHNPPEYNGYKVYWKDGGQIVPPIDKLLIEEINNVSFEEIKFNGNSNLIETIDELIDKEFISSSIKIGKVDKITDRENMKIVFTSLHGTSSTIMPKVFEKIGYKNVLYVPEQMEPDGNFPTVESPNPEEKEALLLGLNLAKQSDADIVIGTDPDADRLGIAVKDLNNDYILLNGNQLMVIMIDFLLNNLKSEDKLNTSQFIATTIVSTPLVGKIANYYNLDCKLCLTGFKWIAKMIEDYPKSSFLIGGEESYGMMISDFVRDKDAITASLFACEIANYLKQNGSSMFKNLIDIYIKYGLYKEELVSITKKGKEGKIEIANIIDGFKNNPPKKIGGSEVISIYNYEKSQKIDLKTNRATKINFPKSNVIEFNTANGTKVILRPSGTEPKIKMYISVTIKLESKEQYLEKNNFLNNRIKAIIEEINL
ncbi:MAG: phospho-sugar mutase [Flavobacteriaceae bacterium]|nr:phospho-sugar mutase [Flavobacteriaceae bacterium]MBT4113311.1 phospho-sugar mutase [Flavobacteriaceae bacterium]MBT4614718.1 phospho-sugar mutase [Flavobacteriaceae bacterium]MBT5247084.1 phospho-sugar mutase [Flavobacteriaceae bacterium]MBT5649740.1 phospho-sugar mutase [Flavobacteriaceae bacterium]